jgi:hypothetical protein
MYAQDSIELLKDSGIDFARNEARGIDVHRFGEVLMSSGIVLNDEVSPLPIIWTSKMCCSAKFSGCRMIIEISGQLRDKASTKTWEKGCLGVLQAVRLSII